MVSGAYLAVDPLHLDDVCTRLKRLPTVAGVTLHDNMIEAFEKTTKEYMVVFAVILVGFAVVIVVGVVYNCGRIALAERERELARAHREITRLNDERPITVVDQLDRINERMIVTVDQDAAIQAGMLHLSRLDETIDQISKTNADYFMPGNS